MDPQPLNCGWPGGVEPDKQVKVDDAAALVLGDLDVGHRHLLFELPLRDSHQMRELVVDADTGPPPQRARIVYVRRQDAGSVRMARCLGNLGQPLAHRRH
jgi:hypothetical protein